MITSPVAGAVGRGAACTREVVTDVDGTTGSGFGAASSAEARRAIPAAVAAVTAAAQAMIRATLTGRSREAATDGVFGLSVIGPP
jgi:hypothetical protein